MRDSASDRDVLLVEDRLKLGDASLQAPGLFGGEDLLAVLRLFERAPQIVELAREGLQVRPAVPRCS